MIENQKAKAKTTHSVSPRARARGKITTGRIPLNICDSIMIGTSQELDAAAPLFLRCRLTGVFPPTYVFKIEVEVPKLEFRFGRRADSGQNDMAASRRPPNGVAGPVRECFCVRRKGTTGNAKDRPVDLKTRREEKIKGCPRTQR
jgi:hypothetical protein